MNPEPRIVWHLFGPQRCWHIWRGRHWYAYLGRGGGGIAFHCEPCCRREPWRHHGE